jgi:hypothetical protein
LILNSSFRHYVPFGVYVFSIELAVVIFFSSFVFESGLFDLKRLLHFGCRLRSSGELLFACFSISSFYCLFASSLFSFRGMLMWTKYAFWFAFERISRSTSFAALFADRTSATPYLGLWWLCPACRRQPPAAAPGAQILMSAPVAGGPPRDRPGS